MSSTVKALQMNHTTDPKKTIYDGVGKHVDDVTIMGAQILVGIYIRPEMTKGSIILTQATRKEDEWQGKVGLVLKKGPLAFQDDNSHSFGKKTPQVGDWVMFNVGDTFAFHLGDSKARILEDVDVKAILAKPDIVL